MAVSCVVLFVTLLVGSMSIIFGANIRADGDYPFRSDYSFSEQAKGWLKLHQAPSTWTDAKLRCHAEGAVLASPLNVDLQKAILKVVSGELADTIFTGVSAIHSTGSFASVKGEPLSKMPITWTSGEPRDVTRNCLTMKTQGGTVGTVECSSSLPYVCYKEHASLTVTECGTHDRAYNLNTRTGSCYKFHSWGLDWHKAHMTCDAEGGYLVIINSNEEADILWRLLDSVPVDNIFATHQNYCHIGFRDLRDGSSWLTIHGETLVEAGYNVWETGQPDNSTVYNHEGEACGAISRGRGRFNDVPCCLIMSFICEKNPLNI